MLRSVGVDDGVVLVDVNDALLDLTSGDLIDAVAQIVFTASEIPGAQSVLIRVDGATREWPDGSGAPHSGPLTTYDFIGYAESAQPAFPVSPTPTTAVPSSTTTTPRDDDIPGDDDHGADSGADGGADHHDDALDRDDGRGCGGRGPAGGPPPANGPSPAASVRRRPQAGAASSSYEKKISATPW